MQNILTAIVNHDKGTLLDSFLLSLDLAVETGEGDWVDRAGGDVDVDIEGLPAPILCYAITKCSPACVEVLIKRSVSTDSVTESLVRTSDHHLTTSVLLAARRGNAEALQIILRSRLVLSKSEIHKVFLTPALLSHKDTAQGTQYPYFLAFHCVFMP